MNIAWSISIGCVAFVGLVLTGCKGGEAPAPQPAAAPAPGEPHTHGAGPHGGTVADWGGGKYHVEFTVDHEKKEATVYVLGGDEKTLSAVKTNNGGLLLTINEPSFQVVLKAAPDPSDPAGSAAKYVGTHEYLGIVREFSGTISGEIDGTPYAGDFKEEPHGDE
jgi:hypothetical protein